MVRVPARFLSAFRLKWIVAVLLLAAVAAVFGWRSAYVSWQIRSAGKLMALGSVADAAQALQTLRSAEGVENPDRTELLFLLGRASRRTGDFDAAMDYLQRAESSGWDAEQVRVQRQLAMIQRGKIDYDDSALNQLLQKNSSDAAAYEVYEALAKGYLSSYRFSDAIHCLDFWTEWCPSATDPRMWRATVWEQTERWEEANDEYRSVLKINPSHLEARQALARNLLMEQNKASDAYEEFQICLQQSPDDFNALLGTAACERQLAKPESAEKTLRALLLRPLTTEQRSNVRMELSQILMDRGDLSEAVELLTEVTQTDPLNSTAFYSLGTCWSGLGDKDKALEYFERSKRLTEQFGRLTMITTELANNPEQPDLRWEAGKILMDQGMHVEGAAWMATALIYDPRHRATHEALAEYYETIKPDQELAQRHRRMANESNDVHVN
ncbi:MAG: tetratricopeptide repeat protein [Planctomycetaceae bacterium]